MGGSGAGGYEKAGGGTTPTAAGATAMPCCSASAGATGAGAGAAAGAAGGFTGCTTLLSDWNKDCLSCHSLRNTHVHYTLEYHGRRIIECS
jgi:hypothetical protein